MTTNTCQPPPPAPRRSLQRPSSQGGTTFPIIMKGGKGAGGATTLFPTWRLTLRWLVFFLLGVGYLFNVPFQRGDSAATAALYARRSHLVFVNTQHEQTAYTTAAATTATTTTTTTINANYQTWLVIYTHFKRTQAETILFLQTYEMFNNQNLYQKLLFVWDSSQENDSLDMVLPHIPPNMSHHFLYIDMVTETALKRGFDKKRYPEHKCFERGSGYCGMLFYKTQLDLFVQAAADKYSLPVPDIVAVGDGDTYWHTLPVHGNVMDPKGRLIFQTINCTSADSLYAPAVQHLLRTKRYLNGGVTLPIPIWFDSFAKMRHKIIELHQQKTNVERDWFDIYNRVSGPLCEFCLMATYLDIYEPERYRFTRNPCAPQVAVATTNVFGDSSSASAPTIFTAVHDKVKFERSRDTIVKGCCLTYGISKRESKGKCKFKVGDFTELAEFDPWNHVNAYTSPTLLLDHHERVWQTLTVRSAGDNARGREACRRYIAALP